jgi:hypothetical protein
LRVLITIPHYYKQDKTVSYGSSRTTRTERIESVSNCIISLQQHFSRAQYNINYLEETVERANTSNIVDLDILVCTTGNEHLIDGIDLPTGCFTHIPTTSEPMMLGFECRDVLKSCLKRYDYYCFMEDDLIMTDPYFFQKLKHFSETTDIMNVLQPNRFEVSNTNQVVKKCYIDGDAFTPQISTFYRIDGPEHLVNFIGTQVTLRQPLNPHSGCYFLNAEQFEYWTQQPHYNDKDISFVGPLESAATLGLMKTFNVYKAPLEYASYLEIEHSGSNYLQFHSQFVTI